MEIKTNNQGETILSFSEEELKILNNKKQLILPEKTAIEFFSIFMSIFATMNKQIDQYIQNQNKKNG